MVALILIVGYLLLDRIQCIKSDKGYIVVLLCV